jgi:single-strand DNA-binding protein
MGSYSKTILIGHVGKDPELKVTPGGVSICKFSMATSEQWKDAAGEKKERTTWHNLVIFGKSAEAAEKYVKKGDELMVEGKIQNDEYEKEGVKKTFTSIRVDNFVLLGGKKDGAGKPAAARNNDDRNSSATSYDDDLPF